MVSNPEMCHQWCMSASSAHHWWQLGRDRMFFTHLQIKLSSQKKLLIKGQKNSMTINYIRVEHNWRSSPLPFPNPVVTSTVLVSNSKYVCPSSHSSLATDQDIFSNNDGHWRKVKYAIFCDVESTDRKGQCGVSKVLFLLPQQVTWSAEVTRIAPCLHHISGHHCLKNFLDQLPVKND